MAIVVGNCQWLSFLWVRVLGWASHRQSCYRRHPKTMGSAASQHLLIVEELNFRGTTRLYPFMENRMDDAFEWLKYYVWNGVPHCLPGSKLVEFDFSSFFGRIPDMGIGGKKGPKTLRGLWVSKRNQPNERAVGFLHILETSRNYKLYSMNLKLWIWSHYEFDTHK